MAQPSSSVDNGRTHANPPGDPLQYGVGARITIAIMSERYKEIILGAIKQVYDTGLTVEMGDVSTYLGGSEANILRYLTDLCRIISAHECHSTITIHLFRGCPAACAPGIKLRAVDIPVGSTIGHFAAGEWALYPLSDTGDADHMRDIYAAIDFAVKNGTFRESRNSVTRLEGDLGTILETVIAGWMQVGRSVQHVVSHLTLSVNSPSHKKGR